MQAIFWILLLLAVAACELGAWVSHFPGIDLEPHLAAATVVAIGMYFVDAYGDWLFAEARNKVLSLFLLLCLYLGHLGYLAWSYYGIYIMEWSYTVTAEPLFKEPIKEPIGIRLNFEFADKVGEKFYIKSPEIYVYRGGNRLKDLVNLRSSQQFTEPESPTGRKVSYDLYEGEYHDFSRRGWICRRHNKKTPANDATPFSAHEITINWRWEPRSSGGRGLLSRGGFNQNDTLGEKLKKDEAVQKLLPQIASSRQNLLPERLTALGLNACGKKNEYRECYCLPGTEKK